jgi:hypothetical protein
MHDSESDDDAPPKLKVTDRRLFDSEGNFRDGAEEMSANAPDQVLGEASNDDTPPAEAPPSQPAPAEIPAPAALEAPEQLKLGEEALMRFVEEQYIGGLMALGAMPEPQSGQVTEDLDLAQVRIEMLGLLQERVGDNLPPEAKKGLDDVMYQLRMAYLQKSKVAKL